MRKKWVHLFFLAVVLISGVSCMTPAGRTAGEVIDDATITTKVKAKLLTESILKGFAISVQTFEGLVTLIGAVDTAEQKAQAESIARSVSGVVGVNNNLKIKKR
ncbi:MAG: BON domain-containing protein [Deltaproteobacteria bacterium]|nr:BON domain-containing protein [Deltaproteobacteria bacterium]